MSSTKAVSTLLFNIFVYGTLKKGQPNHMLLTNVTNGNANFVSNGQTLNQFPLVIGTRYNIPFLLDKPGTGYNVSGEVYEVNETMLSRLDILEDYPEFYDREQQDIHIEDGNRFVWEI